MSNKYFRFKQFTILQDKAAFKVTTDSVILGAWADFTDANTVLDIGTGTGLLALMTAQRCNADIIAIEPDPDSYLQALSNVSDSKWHNRITVLHTSLQEFVSGTDNKYDVIISNPPYFSGSLLNPDYRKAMARHNFSLPMDVMASASSRLLSERGKLHLVLPAVDGEVFIEKAREYGLYCTATMLVKPTPYLPPKRILISLSRRLRNRETNFLVVEKGERHEYSDEYISLTSDFYLER